MKWIIILTFVALIFVICLYRKAVKDGKEPPDGTHIKYPDPDEEIFSEFNEDEHSPENVISDELIKRVSLRHKLNKIANEEEIEKFGDFDHTRIDGR